MCEIALYLKSKNNTLIKTLLLCTEIFQFNTFLDIHCLSVCLFVDDMMIMQTDSTNLSKETFQKSPEIRAIGFCGAGSEICDIYDYLLHAIMMALHGISILLKCVL